MSEAERDRIRYMLSKDGINTTLIYALSDDELKKADSFTLYDDYEDYMIDMAKKYDI